MERTQDLNAPAIGSTVRVTLRDNVTLSPKVGPKLRSQGASTLTVACRSIVATRPDESGYISLVQDDLAPVPLGGLGKFLIAPMFKNVGVEVRECEAAASDIMPLLEFEQCDHAEDIKIGTNAKGALVDEFKDYGDQLLRLNDYTGAISYYEAALHFVSSNFGVIGGTVIAKKKGHSAIAEVDCVEDDEQNNPRYDVTFLSGEEETITQKDVLLAVWAKDATFLQPRILLNLSRSLLKLADVDTARGNVGCVGKARLSAEKTRQERYRLAAVRGVTIAIALCEYHTAESLTDSVRELDSLIEKARIVRSRAFLGLRKLPNAMVDAKKVLAKNAANREAQVLLADVKTIDAHNKAMDKRLSKEVCRWVQTATNASNAADAMDRMDDSVSEHEADDGVGLNVEDVNPIQRNACGRMIAQWKMARNSNMDICAVCVFIVAIWIGCDFNGQQKLTKLSWLLGFE